MDIDNPLSFFGRALELMGLVIILWGVRRDIRELLRRLGVSSKGWARKVGLGLGIVKPGTVDAEAHGVLGNMTVSAEGEVIPRWPELADDQILWLKDRIAAERVFATRRLAKLQERMADVENRAEARAKALAESSAELRKEFQDSVERTLVPQVVGSFVALLGLGLSAVSDFL